MTVHFHQSSQFEEVRSRIETHLYNSVLELHGDVGAALRSVEEFANSIERVFDVLEQMYQNPKPEDVVGGRSFPVHQGRYRVFFKVMIRSNNDFDITMLDIDDNKQSNLDRFPIHRIVTFDSDEE